MILNKWQDDLIVSNKQIYKINAYTILSIKKKLLSDRYCWEYYINDYYIGYNLKEKEAKEYIEKHAREMFQQTDNNATIKILTDLKDKYSRGVILSYKTENFIDSQIDLAIKQLSI